MEISSPSPGLRERKKQKTRDTIVKVALELFAERGYEQTTIAEIADAAEVSPRTIFAYFPSKEDILFCDLPEVEERLAQALAQRPEGVTALDALREFILESPGFGPNELIRKRIIASNETLLRNERARQAPFEQLMVEAIAKDLNAGADDIRPRIAAAAVIAAFRAVRERGPIKPHASTSPEHAMAILDDVIGFLRAGLEALRHDSPTSAASDTGDVGAIETLSTVGPGSGQLPVSERR
jgi:AcrR family transcriptional regulator